MPVTTDSLNKKLYQLLKTQGFDPVPKNSKGDTTPVPDDADVFRFTYKVDGKPIGPAWITVDSNQELKVYYDDSLMSAGGDDNDPNSADSFTDFLKQLKQWAQRRQLGFDLENQDHLESDMAQREHVKKQEQVNEGYYPMGKSASYNDSVPSVKIILQHTRQIQEGEQRFRNIARIFLENTVGERILAPTTRPGIAKVYARHLAEGGLPHDDRWNHIGSLVEEYTKMAGFVRATRGNQFNESAQQLVNEGINHYQSLRETLSRMIGHKGYNAYFESWTPALMEDETDTDTLNELFVQETMDPRIESVMPILSRIHKKVNEMSEVNELAEWAESIIGEKMVMGASTDASAGGTVSEDESLTSNNPVGIPEGHLHNTGVEDSPVANAITRRILMQRTDLLAKYGPEVVGQAIDSVADFVGDVDEIGSSDVSGWVKQVERELGDSQVEEGFSDIAKKVGGALKTGAKAVGKAIVGKDDDELLRDLKKRAGVRNPQTGKPSMAISDVEKVDEDSDIDGMTPINFEANPSLKELMTRYNQLYYQGHEADVSDQESAEYDAIEQYVAKRFGQKGLDHLHKAANASFWGRDDDRGTGDMRSSNLGMAGTKPGNFRTTKSGVMHKQDAGTLKSKVKGRLGRHPEPMLPEEVAEDLGPEQKRVGQLGPTEKITKSNPTRGKLVGANESVEQGVAEGLNEMDSEGYKGTRDDYELGKGKEGKGKPVTAKKAVSDAEKIMNKAHDKMMKSMSDSEKVDKGWRNPNMKEGQEDLDAILRIIKK